MREHVDEPTRDIYRRIVANAEEGRGVRLSAKEAHLLARDPMVYLAADHDPQEEADDGG